MATVWVTAASWTACIVAGSAVVPGAAGQTPVFRSSVNRVLVPVTVESRDKRIAPPALDVGHLRVTEDRQEQAVALLIREPEPVSLTILLDSSRSMAGPEKRTLAIRAVDAVMASLSSADEVSVQLFHEESRLALPWTPAVPTPVLNWQTWAPAGGTVMTDAFAHALGHAAQATHRKRVILIVSDGMASTGRITVQRAARSRAQSEVLVYAFHITAGGRRMIRPAGPTGGGSLDVPPDEAKVSGFLEQQLPSLVGDSGGVVFPVATTARATDAVHAFVTELANQYVIAYEPTRPPDGTFRQIRIETTRRDIRLRHRRGYLASVP